MFSRTRLTAAFCGIALATGALTVFTAAPASATAETCSSYLSSIDELAAFTGGVVCTATEIGASVLGEDAALAVCGIAMAAATVLSGLASEEIDEACSLAVQP